MSDSSLTALSDTSSLTPLSDTNSLVDLSEPNSNILNKRAIKFSQQKCSKKRSGGDVDWTGMIDDCSQVNGGFSDSSDSNNSSEEVRRMLVPCVKI